ncbi:hypothetical protein MLD38_018316 [Melastoma candidum]|uniref:Uncharacterized protein n=1 Tax=Melastoma candidum TaxID=119954 RepID=A0ACB9QUJ2_9MYRT|nr:hypothetical protein MLD38_018316 [Melastoma candidum]
MFPLKCISSANCIGSSERIPVEWRQLCTVLVKRGSKNNGSGSSFHSCFLGMSCRVNAECSRTNNGWLHFKNLFSQSSFADGECSKVFLMKLHISEENHENLGWEHAGALSFTMKTWSTLVHGYTVMGLVVTRKKPKKPSTE